MRKALVGRHVGNVYIYQQQDTNHVLINHTHVEEEQNKVLAFPDTTVMRNEGGSLDFNWLTLLTSQVIRAISRSEVYNSTIGVHRTLEKSNVRTIQILDWVLSQQFLIVHYSLS